MDCFVLDEPVTSLDMSPLGEYLVTTHVDNLGVYLWSNMTLYTHVNLRPLPENFEPHTIMLPSTHITSQGKYKEPKKVRFHLNTNALESQYTQIHYCLCALQVYVKRKMLRKRMSTPLNLRNNYQTN